ncbi:hypothetical protein [Winogradskyella thalassocola]|uniref:Fn3-like domain-containing protein n=1 Tax=Winogradskyella thalassocola TaxID=262004 RepID=A0A1G8CNF5_9FLAO|nr:hypothetical protein [Winogradskyella thalassocola]SDH46862.1 hypothetical protein SAMN04489796_1032 [Winogradskyella thalassocola]
MKTIISIIFVGLSFLSSYGQDLKLSIIQNSDEPDTAKEHFYLVKVTNTSRKATLFSVSAFNAKCSNEKSIETDFTQEILNNNKSLGDKEHTIKPNESMEVFVKLTKPKNSKLNSWNCTQVNAISKNGDVISNTVSIESFIPDPKDFN